MSIYDDMRVFESIVEKAMPSINAAIRQQPTLSDAFARVAPDYSALTSTIAEAAERIEPNHLVVSQMLDTAGQVALDNPGLVSGVLDAMEDVRPGHVAATQMLDAAGQVALDNPNLVSPVLDTMEEVQPESTLASIHVTDSLADVQPQWSAGSIHMADTLGELQPQWSAASLQMTDTLADLQPKLWAASLHVNDALADVQPSPSAASLHVTDTLADVNAVGVLPQINVMSSGLLEGVEKAMPNYDVLVAGLHDAVEQMRPDYTALFPGVFDMVEEMKPDFNAFTSRVLSGIEVPRVDLGILLSPAPEVRLFDASNILTFSNTPHVVESPPATVPSPHPITEIEPEKLTTAQLVVRVSQRFKKYQDGREDLSAMTYAVFTLVVANAGTPREAASKFRISDNLLTMLCRFGSSRGGYEAARKFQRGSVPREFSDDERRMTERALAGLIEHLRLQASSQEERVAILTLDDLRLPGK